MSCDPKHAYHGNTILVFRGIPPNVGNFMFPLALHQATFPNKTNISLLKKALETVAFTELPILSVVEQLDFLKFRKPKKKQNQRRYLFYEPERGGPLRDPTYRGLVFTPEIFGTTRPVFLKESAFKRVPQKKQVGPYCKCLAL